MRTIKLKSLSLVNFKGIRNLDLNFHDQETVICGGNGTGKTTVFDAFLWLLFGKDSTGRSDSNFNIKTIGADGKPILKLEHSVTGVLCVDGRDVKLQRVFQEKWTRPRNTTEETLTSHVTEFYMNDVKLGTKREYEAEVSAILPEDLFKLVTNPFYFNSMKPEVQKQILMDMAGTVTDDEVAALKPEYIELMAQISGRTLEQYAREINAKKKGCKEALSVIPSQIETAQKLMPEAEDWDALQKELQEKKKLLESYDEQLADKSKINDAEAQRKVAIQRQIGEKKIALTRRENAIRENANAGRNDANLKLRDLEYQLESSKSELSRVESKINRVDTDLAEADKSLDVLRAQFRKINGEQLEYPDGAFVCPTCKRPLDPDDVEKKQAEMLANFNQAKAAKLKDNKERGMAKAGQRKELAENRENLIAKAEELKQVIAGKESEIEALKTSIPEAPDFAELFSKDQESIDLQNEIAELENQYTMEAKGVDCSDLMEAKSVLNESIQELYQALAKRDQITRAQKEIDELEEKRIQNNQALADYEKWEFTALSFQKDKDAKLMERINGMFKMASFSFVADQLNGGEKLTCVCTVDGTPYPDVNNAGKINAGIDIINALCKAKGISAPIFVDNRESVNEIIPTISQVINLVVSNDKQLTIK